MSVLLSSSLGRAGEGLGMGFLGLTAMLLFMAGLQGLRAQETVEQAPESRYAATGWYSGIEGGVPFGVSTFSSFGADKTRAGYAFGLFGGYRFNGIISAELTVEWGKASLSARDCCMKSGYWLGADGTTYHAAAADVDGQGYSELKSDVSLQQYGARMNVNLLGLFTATRQSRWTFEVSPVLAAVGTKATVKTIAGGGSLIKDKTRWHLGAGGNLQAGYAITEELRLGVYSGITWLTGKGMDGIREHVHDANFIWESGVRIGWTFGRKRKASNCLTKGEEPEQINHAAIPEGKATAEAPPKGQPTPKEESRDTVSVAMDSASISLSGRQVGASPTFPTVYFAFNRADIETGEQAKLQAILGTLRKYPDVRVLVTGWCDNVGGRAVNDLLSRRRAEAVKAWLVRQGFEASRISTRGMGIDLSEADRTKARRAVTERQKEEVEP